MSPQYMGHWHRSSSRNATEDTGWIKGPSAPRVSHPLTAPSPGEPHPTTAFHTDLLNLQAFLVKDKDKNKIVLRNGDGFCQHEVSKTNHERKRGGGEHGRHRCEPSRARGCTPGSSARDTGRRQRDRGAARRGPARADSGAATPGDQEHRKAPATPAGPCPVPSCPPPSRHQRRRSVSPRERGGDRAGSSAGPGAHAWARSGLPHLRAVLQRLLDGQLVDAGHGGGRADCAPLQLRSPQRSDPPLLPGHNTASPAPLRAGCPALPAWPFHWFFHPACPACYWWAGLSVCLHERAARGRLRGGSGSRRGSLPSPPCPLRDPRPLPTRDTGAGKRRLLAVTSAPASRKSAPSPAAASGEWGSETDRDVSTLWCSAQVMVVKRSFWKKSKQTFFFFLVVMYMLCVTNQYVLLALVVFIWRLLS